MLARPVLLYDGDCAFCRAWVARIGRWDRRNRIDCLPAAARSGRAGLPHLSDDVVSARMHLILPDGRVFAGGTAVPELLGLLPGGRLLRLVFVVPGMPSLVRAAYDWVARRRHRLGCGAGACGDAA